MAIQQLPRTRRIHRPAYNKTTLQAAVTPPAIEVLTLVERPSGGSSVTAWARMQLGSTANPSLGWLPIGLMLLMFQSVALQPSLSEAELAAITPIEDIIGYGIVGGALAAYLGASAWAFAGRGGGFLLSLPATVIMAALIFSCPTSGHHAWGSWVLPSFGLAAPAVALHTGSLFAVRKSR